MWLRRFASQTILVVSLCLTPPGLADFESASEAYRAQDYPTAFEEFSALAKAGDPRAQSVLAIMYKYGESVTLDLEEAYQWYHLAAVQGYPPAQFNVGLMLAEGRGVEQDEDEALKWLSLAADAGYERANDKIAEIKGFQTYAIGTREPIAWSKSWNLRLPNDIRNQETEDVSLPVDSITVFRVQLGAMSSITAAEHLWHQVSAGNEDLFDAYQPIFKKAAPGGRALFRLQVGPFDDKAHADEFCALLTARMDNGCLVVLSR